LETARKTDPLFNEAVHTKLVTASKNMVQTHLENLAKVSYATESSKADDIAATLAKSLTQTLTSFWTSLTPDQAAALTTKITEGLKPVARSIVAKDDNLDIICNAFESKTRHAKKYEVERGHEVTKINDMITSYGDGDLSALNATSGPLDRLAVLSSGIEAKQAAAVSGDDSSIINAKLDEIDKTFTDVVIPTTESTGIDKLTWICKNGFVPISLQTTLAERITNLTTNKGDKILKDAVTTPAEYNSTLEALIIQEKTNMLVEIHDQATTNMVADSQVGAVKAAFVEKVYEAADLAGQIALIVGRINELSETSDELSDLQTHLAEFYSKECPDNITKDTTAADLKDAGCGSAILGKIALEFKHIADAESQQLANYNAVVTHTIDSYEKLKPLEKSVVQQIRSNADNEEAGGHCTNNEICR
jgi:hypothetical protein